MNAPGGISLAGEQRPGECYKCYANGKVQLKGVLVAY